MLITKDCFWYFSPCHYKCFQKLQIGPFLFMNKARNACFQGLPSKKLPQLAPLASNTQELSYGSQNNFSLHLTAKLDSHHFVFTNACEVAPTEGASWSLHALKVIPEPPKVLEKSADTVSYCSVSFKFPAWECLAPSSASLHSNV